MGNLEVEMFIWGTICETLLVKLTFKLLGGISDTYRLYFCPLLGLVMPP